MNEHDAQGGDAVDLHEDLVVLGQAHPAAERGERHIIAGAAIVTAIASVVFTVGLLRGASLVVYGTALAVALLAP